MTPAALVPHLILIAPRGNALVDAWRRAIALYFPSEADAREQFTVREGRLQELEADEVRHDCLVSPANSYGIMDGGFDLDLSRIFQGPSADMDRLSAHVQAALRARWNGYAPPGTCTLVALPEDVRGEGRNAWGTHTLAVVPTMKMPERVAWNEELVYNGMSALLAAVRSPTAAAAAAGTGTGTGTIRRVLMTGLGTGTGGVSAERCARQMILAVKHFRSPLPERVRWADVGRRNRELDVTRAL